MKRKKYPTLSFSTKFEAALQAFSVRFLKSSSYKSASAKGTAREVPLQEFFIEHLPETFRVAKGEVVDVYDSHGPELDVVIYDKLRNYAFENDSVLILPAEALLASIEVKSTLTRDEIRRSLRAAQKLKALKPFREKVAKPKREGAWRDYKCRYFHSIFAYQTDLAADDWLRSENRRFSDVAKELGIPRDTIDRVYVAERGMLNIPAEAGIGETAESGAGLMHFYMHILNFLLRENAKRKPVPIMDYAGRLTKGWRKLS